MRLKISGGAAKMGANVWKWEGDWDNLPSSATNLYVLGVTLLEICGVTKDQILEEVEADKIKVETLSVGSETFSVISLWELKKWFDCGSDLAEMAEESFREYIKVGDLDIAYLVRETIH